MIVDTSAILAILLDEPESDTFLAAIMNEERRTMSAASYVEAGLRVDRHANAEAHAMLDRLLDRLAIAVAPVTLEQAKAARTALRAYGKGRHPAALNYGDSFVYALAATAREPLLFKGDDFARTDLALWQPRA